MPEKAKRKDILLAYHVDEGKLRRMGNILYGQPKLNGERCYVNWFRDEPVLISSTGHIFSYLDHIKEELITRYKDWTIKPTLDGELYRHGWPFNRIASAANCTVNYNPDNAYLQLHSFDMHDLSGKLPQATRLAMLARCFSGKENATEEPLILVPTFSVNHENWLQTGMFLVDVGYEGLIIRCTDTFYKDGRSVKMLKFKPTEADSYKIVGITEAVSQDGDLKGMVGAFIVEDNDSKSFKVSAGKLTHEKRIFYWETRDQLLGKTLLVKHEKLKTVNGVPVCAVAVEVED